jgi:predicted P-loop ATPase
MSKRDDANGLALKYGTERLREVIDATRGVPIPNWPDLKFGGRAAASTCANARVAIQALGIECRYDAFHDRLLVGGHMLQEWIGELSDHACLMLRKIIKQEFDFDPGKANTSDAAVQLCLENQFDPVRDYLDGLKWDEGRRLETWLQNYLGAEDTPLVRKFGELTLIAAVRRARRPGCKKDEVLVLEGPEGTGKSTALSILAGADNFSDQTILGLSDKEQQEACAGVWIYEIADLAGLRGAEVERTKAFASRTHDRARPAYGHHRVNQPRRCVYTATTNDEEYLKSNTGDRRFWPVKTGKIDLNALRRDRDQLWAEAAHVEATGVSLHLPDELWKAAGVEQGKRQEKDPWQDILRQVRGDRVLTMHLLTNVIQIKPDKQTNRDTKRLSACMKRLGWTKAPNAIRVEGVQGQGYIRTEPQEEEQV